MANTHEFHIGQNMQPSHEMIHTLITPVSSLPHLFAIISNTTRGCTWASVPTRGCLQTLVSELHGIYIEELGGFIPMQNVTDIMFSF